MNHFNHERFDWLNEQVCRIGDVVFSGIEDPNGYLSSLPKSDQCAFHIGKFMSQVGNGGLHEYVSGPYADDIQNCAYYLSQIGADAVSDSLKHLTAYLPEEYLAFDRGGRDDALRVVCRENGVKSCDELISIDIDSIDLEALYIYCTQAKNLV